MVLVIPVIRRFFPSIYLPFLTVSLCRDNAIYDFSKKAVENGLDIFRVFDSLNYIENVSDHFVLANLANFYSRR